VRRILFLITIGFCLAAFDARAAHTQVQLFLSANPARPGDTIWAGVDLKMDAGWHTYWKNSGDSGIATTIKWDLPPGVTAGEIQWPLPKKLPPAEVTTYGYEDEVMLLVPLTLATNLNPGALDLKANVAWLECQEQCVPGNTTVAAKLNIGSETKISADAAAIETWKSKVPSELNSNEWFICAWWRSLSTNDTRQLVITAVPENSKATSKYDKSDFFPDANDNYEIQSATENLLGQKPGFRLGKTVKKFSGAWPKKVSGVIIFDENGQQQKISATISIIAEQSPFQTAIQSSNNVTTISDTSSTPALPAQSLWQMLLYAFIGGLILNIMPCVLPVIALKILGFVNEAKSEPRRVRALGLVYALGVLVSFLVLAGIVISVKASGIIPGWGMQFGSPIFIVCLTTLVTLVALNLFGVFEVVLGGRVSNTAGELASKHGAAGAFFNGVLATTLATPCTAPFLAPALGFAFAQSAGIILLIFLAVGLGLASPYILLSWNPAWLKFLPKPGAWMEKFKIAMGFPMLATIVWLFQIAASSYGKNVLWLGVFLVIVAFAAWIFGEFVQRGRTRKTLAAIIALLLLVGGYAFALEKELDWRAPYIQTQMNGSLKESADGIDWQPWSPEAVAQARASGHPVIVDFTADWCLTCQVNKKTSIEIPSVRKKIKDLNAVAFVGDNTHFPKNIAEELQRFQRAGVPLVLVYPKNPDAQPVALPEVLTPGIVLDALDNAAK
jgi:thiol:disulfide interchange protein/DsbC/DsbD-like thiol-disulfide interchange protein